MEKLQERDPQGIYRQARWPASCARSPAWTCRTSRRARAEVTVHTDQLTVEEEGTRVFQALVDAKLSARPSSGGSPAGSGPGAGSRRRPLAAARGRSSTPRRRRARRRRRRAGGRGAASSARQTRAIADAPASGAQARPRAGRDPAAGSGYKTRRMSPTALEDLRRASEPKLRRPEGRRRRLRERGDRLLRRASTPPSCSRSPARCWATRRSALTAHSPSVPEAERAEARALARRASARATSRWRATSRTIPATSRTAPTAATTASPSSTGCARRPRRRRGSRSVLDGFNADDRRDHRPGHQAALERRVRSPLAEAGLTKDEVRAWSARLRPAHLGQAADGLPRLAHPLRHPVTPERLSQVERAEAALRAIGLPRHPGAPPRRHRPARGGGGGARGGLRPPRRAGRRA